MNLYVAATRQNDGKTIISLGLLSLLRKKIKKLAYMKPVGQQYRIVNNKKIDKDAILMQRIFNFSDHLPNMSPIAIPRGFTEKYILEGKRETLARKVKKAYNNLAKTSDFVLIEGTGHAGVGSVFDMSNADVAKLLNAKVVIVSCGGVGRPIDEIMLNYAKFETVGAEVIGVIVNKVKKEKYKKINSIIRKGLARKGIETLGVIPFEEVLFNPTVWELFEDLEGDLICGENGMNNVVERFIIGDVVAHEALDHVKGSTLLIAPGNREDFIFSALSGWALGITKNYSIAGVISTYGKKPAKKVVQLLDKANIPLIVVKGDSFSTAKKINSMIFKLRADDKPKIAQTSKVIEKYVDIDKILDLIKNNSRHSRERRHSRESGNLK